MMRGSSTMLPASGCSEDNGDAESNVDVDQGNVDQGNVDYSRLLDDMVQPRCRCYDDCSSTRRL